MSSIRLTQRRPLGRSVHVPPSAWAVVLALTVVALLGFVVGHFDWTGIAKALGDLLPAELTRWPIYTT